MEMNRKVDGYLSKAKQWREEMTRLREIVCGVPELVEEMKWGHPCYTFEGGNVVLIHGFKEYCALLFFKGALLKDGKGILVQQTENVQGARQVRFRSVEEIGKLERVLRDYIKEAVEVERRGLKVEFKGTAAFEMVEEFRKRLNGDGRLKKAFEALTPGRQRGYLLYFAQAKQSTTREARVEKCVPRILEGMGLKDE
jgi:uncharacterized protein YdeI (YjbR/CyaY-like superfamily)